MKTMFNTVLEFVSFLLLMFALGMGTILYAIFVAGYWVYAKVTGQEDLIQ